MERAQPGAQRSIARNIEFGESVGQFSEGWIVPAGSPTLSAQRSSVDETTFGEFDATYSASSFDVDIAPSEAYVSGWIATDEVYTITLAASTMGQRVVLGWNPDAIYDDQVHNTRAEADELYVALESDVPSDDPYVAIWEFVTDGSGVINATDLRQIGSPLGGGGITYISDSEPLGAELKETWFNTDDQYLYVYAEVLGSTSKQWVQVTDQAVWRENYDGSEPTVRNGHLYYDGSEEELKVGAKTSAGGNVEWRQISKSSSEIDHDQTNGGTSGNPHADSAHVDDVAEIVKTGSITVDSGTPSSPIDSNAGYTTEILYGESIDGGGTNNPIDIIHEINLSIKISGETGWDSYTIYSETKNGSGDGTKNRIDVEELDVSISPYVIEDSSDGTSIVATEFGYNYTIYRTP